MGACAKRTLERANVLFDDRASIDESTLHASSSRSRFSTPDGCGCPRQRLPRACLLALQQESYDDPYGRLKRCAEKRLRQRTGMSLAGLRRPMQGFNARTLTPDGRIRCSDSHTRPSFATFPSNTPHSPGRADGMDPRPLARSRPPILDPKRGSAVSPDDGLFSSDTTSSAGGSSAEHGDPRPALGSSRGGRVRNLARFAREQSTSSHRRATRTHAENNAPKAPQTKRGSAGRTLFGTGLAPTAACAREFSARGAVGGNERPNLPAHIERPDDKLRRHEASMDSPSFCTDRTGVSFRIAAFKGRSFEFVGGTATAPVVPRDAGTPGGLGRISDCRIDRDRTLQSAAWVAMRRSLVWAALVGALLALLGALQLGGRPGGRSDASADGASAANPGVLRGSPADFAALHAPSQAYCERVRVRGVPVACAHGGDARSGPPNSIAALTAATAAGHTCVEVDASVSRDGVAFAAHPLDIKRLLRAAGRPELEPGSLLASEVAALRWPEHDGDGFATLEQALAAVRQSAIGAGAPPPNVTIDLEIPIEVRTWARGVAERVRTDEEFEDARAGVQVRKQARARGKKSVRFGRVRLSFRNVFLFFSSRFSLHRRRTTVDAPCWLGQQRRLWQLRAAIGAWHGPSVTRSQFSTAAMRSRHGPDCVA